MMRTSGERQAEQPHNKMLQCLRIGPLLGVQVRKHMSRETENEVGEIHCRKLPLIEAVILQEHP